MKKVVIASLRLPDGRVVLQRRTKDAPVNAGLLGHFGGHVEEGESFDLAIRRELTEETSLPVDTLQFKTLPQFFVEREGKMVEYHPYDILINDMNFAVYEGEGAEAHSMEDMVNREDLSSSVKHMLELMTKENHV